MRILILLFIINIKIGHNIYYYEFMVYSILKYRYNSEVSRKELNAELNLLSTCLLHVRVRKPEMYLTPVCSSTNIVL